ncbi:MAG: undecaprenyldiphospho-muramoylpentapeptide beta-N-acetylglucosaminyltransferase [Thermodesulfovibrionia bacterium]|nr:undecaprenyldiphospho-muramoylpentapeptide beta-N-acetylglucosaminyltransferase [Thermodesulfovibrionia bacterium]
MKIVIAGGGTGGHLFPGLAVAKALKKIPGADVVFVGSTKGIENKIIPKEGFDLRFIRSEGLVGKGIIGTLKSAMKIPHSFRDSFEILKEIKPDLAFGVGGYSSGPLILSAVWMKIPTMIHEQNTVPGLTNRILGKYVDTVAVTYHESISSFPSEKTFLTGNPVREEILNGDRERGYERFSLDKDLFTIFIFGGSSGARHINKAVTEALRYFDAYKDKVQFLHQTGEADLVPVREAYLSQGFKGTVISFAHEMADAYAVADLIISRAGATTLAELAACGKAAILVPYPFAAGKHQESNARKLLDMGAAQMIIDEELNGKTLSDMIIRLLDSPDAIGEMERTIISLGEPDAVKKIIEHMMGLIKK